MSIEQKKDSTENIVTQKKDISPAEQAASQENISAKIAANMTDVPETLEMPVKETAQQKEEKVADTRSRLGRLFNLKTPEQKAAAKKEAEDRKFEKIKESIFEDDSRFEGEYKKIQMESPEKAKKWIEAKNKFGSKASIVWSEKRNEYIPTKIETAEEKIGRKLKEPGFAKEYEKLLGTDPERAEKYKNALSFGNFAWDETINDYKDTTKWGGNTNSAGGPTAGA